MDWMIVLGGLAAILWIARAGYQAGRLSTVDRPVTPQEARRKPGTWA